MGLEERDGEPAKKMGRVTKLGFAFYRFVISPILHYSGLGGCKFRPTCSEYAEVAILRHGLLRGGWLAVHRIVRCNPLGKGGFDPVPE